MPFLEGVPSPQQGTRVAEAAVRRIMIIGGNAEEHAALADSLRGGGFELVLARSAPEALELFARQPVNCILVTWGWDGLDGADACRLLESFATARAIPRLVLCAEETPATVLAAFAAGADDCMARSGNPALLLARVQAQLRRKQLEEEERERKQLEELSATATAARKSAEVAGRAKSEFLFAMSQELRTPLNALLGFAQLLERERREPLPERHQERVRQILRSGKQLVRLLEDILDLSRIESSAASIAIERVDVMPLLREVLAGLTPLAARGSIGIEVDCALAEVPQIAADPTRFVQVLMNLGSNAIKYNRPAGKVTFGVLPSGADRLRVRVQDTGPGIREELQPRVFQPFQRLGQESGPIEGSGIGLVITQQLVRCMNGELGFRSAPGVGSEFWVDLPLAAGA